MKNQFMMVLPHKLGGLGDAFAKHLGELQPKCNDVYEAGVLALGLTLNEQTPESMEGLSGVDVGEFIRHAMPFVLSIYESETEMDDDDAPKTPIDPKEVN